MIMFTWQPFVLTVVLAPGFLLCPDRAITAATSGARLFKPSCGITLQTSIQPHTYPSRRRHAASDQTRVCWLYRFSDLAARVVPYPTWELASKNFKRARCARSICKAE